MDQYNHRVHSNSNYVTFTIEDPYCVLPSLHKVFIFIIIIIIIISIIIVIIIIRRAHSARSAQGHCTAGTSTS